MSQPILSQPALKVQTKEHFELDEPEMSASTVHFISQIHCNISDANAVSTDKSTELNEKAKVRLSGHSTTFESFPN